jgi:hypothetical protein
MPVEATLFSDELFEIPRALLMVDSQALSSPVGHFAGLLRRPKDSRRLGCFGSRLAVTSRGPIQIAEEQGWPFPQAGIAI